MDCLGFGQIFKDLEKTFKELSKIEKQINTAFKNSKPSGNHIKDLANMAIMEVELTDLIEEHEKLTASLIEDFLKNGVPELVAGHTRNQLRFEKSAYTLKFMTRVCTTIFNSFDEEGK